jgi:hypothetical protein
MTRLRPEAARGRFGEAQASRVLISATLVAIAMAEAHRQPQAGSRSITAAGYIASKATRGRDRVSRPGAIPLRQPWQQGDLHRSSKDGSRARRGIFQQPMSRTAEIFPVRATRGKLR